jgi:hypothetical protein
MSDDQRSQSQFVSSAIGRSNKAVTQIARDAKSTAFITGRRVTADEAGKKDGGCSSAARICGRRETDRLGDGLGRLDAGNSTAILSDDPNSHPRLSTGGCDQTGINCTSR